jgi:hypothetical protein
MPTLRLLIFKNFPLFPNDWAHWVLFVPYEENGSHGYYYGVHKRAIYSKKTQIQSRNNYTINAVEIEHDVAIHEINIQGQDVLSYACHQVINTPSPRHGGTTRYFHLFESNCQHWVFEVIECLAEQFGVDGPGIIRRIQELGHVPNGGYTTRKQ